MPAETAGDQENRSREILQRSDSLIQKSYWETDYSELLEGFTAAICYESDCNMMSYLSGDSGLSELGTLNLGIPVNGIDPLEFFVDNLGLLDPEADAASAVLTKNGITLIEERGGTGRVVGRPDRIRIRFGNRQAGGGGPNYREYGAWLDHGTFRVMTAAQDTFSIEDETYTQTFRGGASAGGDLAGSRPSVNATWNGVMAGTPSGDAHRDSILQGDATLAYDAGSRTLKADFTKIVNLDLGVPHTVTAVSFVRVPVADDGTYATSAGVDDFIEGGIMGTGHEETAGVFEQRGVIGAFGAKR